MELYADEHDSFGDVCFVIHSTFIFIFFLIFYMKLKASLYFGRGFFVIQLEFGAPRKTTEGSQAERGCNHVYT